MSRFSDDFDEDWQNQGAMHWANVQRSTRGKAGKAVLQELIAALEAMPVHELHEGFLANPGTGARCAVGALVVHRLQAQGMTEQEALLKASGDECECSWGGTHTLAQHDENGCTVQVQGWFGQDPPHPCECKAWRPVAVTAYEAVEIAEQLLLPDLVAKVKAPHNVMTEAMWENDEGFWAHQYAEPERPRMRWKWVRAWAEEAMGQLP